MISTPRAEPTRQRYRPALGVEYFSEGSRVRRLLVVTLWAQWKSKNLALGFRLPEQRVWLRLKETSNIESTSDGFRLLRPPPQAIHLPRAGVDCQPLFTSGILRSRLP